MVENINFSNVLHVTYSVDTEQKRNRKIFTIIKFLYLSRVSAQKVFEHSAVRRTSDGVIHHLHHHGFVLPNQHLL
ncbi:hypothetical protein JOB18_038970 [Solea senegalensis]|uniref:Uncharacterized protein n=1 Tax=Solea senegalensis TaxID=28829 RepID=A0AAV6QWY4_SOLSE|nr:hypothetical protein JOB18_038970 [Solea senegalensis]